MVIFMPAVCGDVVLDYIILKLFLEFCVLRQIHHHHKLQALKKKKKKNTIHLSSVKK